MIDYKNDWLTEWTGRIPECLERYPLGHETIIELQSLLTDEIHFNEACLASRGWVGIEAENCGELDDEMDLLVDYAHQHGIDTLFATSRYELDRARAGKVLVAHIKNFTAEDIFTLQRGGWMYESRAEPLIEKDVLWHTWREAFYFTLPLSFALIRLVDGDGSTTIIGPPDLIEMIKTQSRHGMYEWLDWPRS